MAVTKPKTQKFEAFNGLAILEIVPPTFYGEALAGEWIARFNEYDVNKDAPMWQLNIVHWGALTVGVEYDGTDDSGVLIPLVEFLRMHKAGASVQELVNYWGENANKALYREWERVIEARYDLGLPRPLTGGADVTDAEKADPK
jgi:hypothetical protein